MPLIFSVLKKCYFPNLLMISLILWGGITPVAHAIDPYQICIPDGGTHVYTVSDVQTTITDIDKNKAGSITDDIPFEISGTYTTHGCDANTQAFITTTSNLPPIGMDDRPVSCKSDGNYSQGVWYQVNEYLAISMQSWVGGLKMCYVAVPFISYGNASALDGQLWASGSRGKVSIKILRPFVGFSAFSTMIMHTQISKNKNVGAAGPDVSAVYMSGQMNVPQSCELNGGETITADFGDIGSNLFVQAGAGNKPAGVDPKMLQFRIKCKNIDAAALLSLRLEANNVAGNAIVSDNKDIGFIVANPVNKEPLTPNDINSKIRFRMNGDASAPMLLSAWPVSVTGKKPAVGKFMSEGYLRVDFD